MKGRYLEDDDTCRTQCFGTIYVVLGEFKRLVFRTLYVIPWGFSFLHNERCLSRRNDMFNYSAFQDPLMASLFCMDGQVTAKSRIFGVPNIQSHIRSSKL